VFAVWEPMPMSLVLVQASLRGALAISWRQPASELAGYFQWSLRDLVRGYARTLQSNPLLTVAQNAGPGGTV